MKKYLKVQQDAQENTVVQVSYDNSNHFTSRFACITVIEGPSLSFGAWLYIFKKEILERYREDIEEILEEYNEYYRHARVEAREMFRQAENPNWDALAERTAFEKVENDNGTEYRFISKRIIEPMFEAGSICIEKLLVTPDWTVRQAPKHLYPICTMWKHLNWNKFIEEVTYEETDVKEYDWNAVEPSVSLKDIIC